MQNSIVVKVQETTEHKGNIVFHATVENSDMIKSEFKYIPVIRHKTRGFLVIYDSNEALKVREGDVENVLGTPVLESELAECRLEEVLVKKAVKRVYTQVYCK